MQHLPIAVDLDGTLCRTNTIWEQIITLLRARPWMFFVLPFWLLIGGRPAFKIRLAEASPLDRIALPFHPGLVSYLREQTAKGREIVLVTAADQSSATHIASLFPFFKEGIGSHASVNLAGTAKADALVKKYGEKAFVYAGNEHRDLKVWAHSGGAIVVNPSIGLEHAAERICPIEKSFEDRPSHVITVVRAMRPHHWLKNVLVFVPVITSLTFENVPVLWNALLAFVAFCAAASAAYVLNDLVDLPSDRAHETKRMRPFAVGDLPVQWGLVLCPLLLIVACVALVTLPPVAHVTLAAYVILTLLYSFIFKRLFLIDAVVLACLFAIRIFMGHAATGIPYSPWLTSFAVCMCLSLALLKRFSELRGRAEGYVPGRGYHTDHRVGIGRVGVVCGVLSSIVIAAYAGSEQVRLLYAQPYLLYLLSPLFFFWTVRMWRLGYQGNMHGDPVLFTLKDPMSIGVGVATAVIMLLAR